MNNWKVYASIVAVLLIGFAIGRWTVKEHIIQVPIVVNLDSLKNVWLTGKVDKVKYDELLASNEWLRAQPAKIRTVTLHDTIPGEPIIDSVDVFSTQLDTAQLAHVSITQGDSTWTDSVTVDTKLDISFYGYPVNMFNIHTLAVSPIRVNVPIKERVIDQTNTFGLWLTTGTRLTTGVALQYGWIFAGIEYHPEWNKGEARLGFRVLGL